MARTAEIKPSHTPSELRRLAASTKDANQSRRLPSMAAVLDGMSRREAAKIGGMGRQRLRDRVRRFNAFGPSGLKDISARSRHPKQDGEVIQAFKKNFPRTLAAPSLA